MDSTIAAISDEFFRAFTEAEPFSATMLGVRSVDDRVPDPSTEGRARVRADFAGIVERAEAVDPETLHGDDRVSRALLVTQSAAVVDEVDAGWEEFSATAFFVGPQAQVLACVPKVVLATADDAEAYVTRLSRLGEFLDASAERLAEGARRGRTATKRGVADSVAQIDRYLSLELADDPLAAPPPPAGWDGGPAWLDRREALLRDSVRPAMQRLRDRLRDDVAPAARDDESSGLRWLDGGDELYRRAVRVHTTTDRTPEEIHSLGVEIVEALADEYREVGERVFATTDLQEIFGRLRDDPELRFADGAEAVRAAEAAVARASEVVPDWFGRLPRTPCEVRAIPEIEARGMTVAYYRPPAEDGSTPGTYWVNPVGPVITRYENECVAYHEALPGHHLQLGIQQELEELPDFRRRLLMITAYAEGWGLYTERLADEMGLYSGELDRLGMLSCDSMRACRLVVDTGLHHLGWSRDEAIEYMSANSPLARSFVTAEVDRYIVIPGQATGYMIGRIEIRRLRDEARAALGPDFDIKGFHDAVLGSGAVGLEVLAGIVEDWVTASGG